MKFNTLRHLILPWFLLFCLIIMAMLFESITLQLGPTFQQYYLAALGVGVLLCLFFNLRTLTKSGIWLANSLPSYLSRRPWLWILRAAIAVGFAAGIYVIGKSSWAPIFWQGMIVPGVFMICLFLAIWSLMGPLLIFCSRVAFSRFAAFVLSWPIFIFVPITAVYLGQMITMAYQESRPDFASTQVSAVEPKSAEETQHNPKAEETISATSKSALDLQAQISDVKNCPTRSKLILASLSSSAEPDTAYWALRALECAEIKAILVLPKLADIMMKHPNTIVRTEAIRKLPKYGTENVKRIGYLLVKRISENEPLPVIEAAALVMLKLGEEERAWLSKRLTALLNSPKTSALASKILVANLRREDLVSEFVASNLTPTSSQRGRAITMICSLPEQTRKIAEPHIELILSSIKTGELSDPAVKALECLGTPALDALRREISTPQKIKKPIAARAFAEARWKEQNSVLETASICVRDADTVVRDWCSQALGEVGALALPKIMELLQSEDASLKTAATHALTFFTDSEGRQELVKERGRNSGWMANQKNLEVARAIDQALINMNSMVTNVQ